MLRKMDSALLVDGLIHIQCIHAYIVVPHTLIVAEKNVQHIENYMIILNMVLEVAQIAKEVAVCHIVQNMEKVLASAHTL